MRLVVSSPNNNNCWSKPPTVWEIDEKRAVGAFGYEVVHPNDDEKNNYTSVFDASGRSDLLDDWIGHCAWELRLC